MDRPTPSPEAQARYDLIAARLAAEAGATTGKMMGMPTIYLGGKALAGLFGEAMVFKLEGDAHARALRLPGALLFDPSGMGRPMKAWVRVPAEEAAEWPDLANAAAAGIDGGR
jgi:hypothetical protein